MKHTQDLNKFKMKKLTTLLFTLLSLGCLAQNKEPYTKRVDNAPVIHGMFPSITTLNTSIGIFPYQTQSYTYLYIVGKVGFVSKNAWLITVKDTTKLCIKYADSVFILHISPKFVKKINDSTYTFQNEK